MGKNSKKSIPIWVVVLPFLVLLWLAADSEAESQPRGPQPYGGKNQWDLVFNENFDGQALDRNKWTTCYWWGNEGCTIQSNHELEWYTPANVSLRDGALQLTAQRQTVIGSDGNAYPYTSGMVSTGARSGNTKSPPLFAFEYGFVKVRAWVPKGQGLLPAIWMLPADQQSNPEIDVMEMLGSDPRTVHMNFHYRNSIGKEEASEGQWISPTELAGGWHVFALDWEPGRITWFVDGIKRREFTQTDLIPSKPMYLIIDLAVGGDWPGSPDANTPFPSTFIIDYVRVWKSGGDVAQSPTDDTHTDAMQPDQNSFPSCDPREIVTYSGSGMDSSPLPRSIRNALYF
ncbi:MAG: glycoside hydrolase family 16 protein [Chloroflexi bacterium]|nr:glycoside hydrolase family 16 protein [Chloroflexota bacterium]